MEKIVIKEIANEFWLERIGAFESTRLTGPSLSNQRSKWLSVTRAPEPPVAEKLKKIGAGKLVNAFAMGLAALSAVLSKYGVSKQCIATTPIAGGAATPIDNFLFFQFDHGNQPDSFAGIVASIQEQLKLIFPYREYDARRVLELLGARGGVPESVFSTGYAVEGFNAFSTEAAQRFDVFFWLRSDFSIELHFRESRFTQAFCGRLLGHFGRMLALLADAPRTSTAQVDVLTGEERQELLFSLNHTAAPFPEAATLVSLFEAQATERPHAPAVVCGERQLTFADLDRKSTLLAGFLAQKYPLSPGQPIPIAMEKSEWLIIGILGILKAGGAYVPIDPSSPTERLEFLLSDINCPFIVCDRHFALQFDARRYDKVDVSSDWHLIGNAPLPSRPQTLVATSPAYVIYTSGSTGKPKGVVVEHRGVVNRLDWMWKHYAFTTGDRILQKTPHIFDVSVWELFLPLCYGCVMVVPARQVAADPAMLIAEVERHAITTMHFVPNMLDAFLAVVRADLPRMKTLRQVFASGEALTPATVGQFYKLFNIPLHNLYGPTEASVDVSFHDTRSAGALVPIGKPISNLQLYILDEALALVPKGVAGQVCIAGAGLARGYLNRPELTGEKFVPHPFRAGERLYLTGDFGRFQEDGSIEYLGRRDFQVKIRGHRIELQEIESAMLTFAGIANAAVIVDETVHSDKTLIACYTSARDLDRHAIEIHLRRSLPQYMVPAVFVRIAQFPRTSSGKVDRRALAAMALADQAVGTRVKTPATPSEMQLLGIWKTVLKNPDIGIHDDFFQVGGDSIKAIRIVAEIARQFSTSLQVKDVFNSPNIRDLAKVIDRFAAPQVAAAPSPDAGEDSFTAPADLPATAVDAYPLSDIQLGMVFHNFLAGDSGVYVDQFFYRLNDNEFSLSAFERSFRILAERHEMLRTSIHVFASDTPFQVIHRSDGFSPDIQFEDWSHVPEHEQGLLLNQIIDEKKESTLELTRAGLWKSRLFKLSRNEYGFLWIFHHAMLDGWSNAQLMKELAAVYAAVKKGKDVSSVPLKANYKHFVREQERLKRSGVLPAFWKSEMQGFTSGALPFHRVPSRHVYDKSYEIRTVQLGAGLARGLKHVSQSIRVPLKDIMLAAFCYLLELTTNEAELCVGLVTNARPDREDGEKIIGCFLNSVPFRFGKKNPADTTLQYLIAISDRARKIKNVDKLPLREIARLNGVETTGRNPFFESLFIYTDFETSEPAPDSALNLNAPFIGGFENTNTALDLNVDNSSGQLMITFKALRALFDADQLDRIQTYYHDILEVIGANDVLSAGNVLGKSAETVRELHGQAGTDAFETVMSMFGKQVAATPQKPAVHFRGYSLSYQALDEKVVHLAGQIRQLQGDNPGIVAFMLERSEFLPIVMLAVLRSGAAYLPIDPRYPRDRVEYILRDSACNLLVTNEKFLPMDLGVERVIVIEETPARPPAEGPDGPVAVEPGSPAYVIYTSGSTGRPKGVVLSHQNIANFCHGMRSALPLDGTDHILAMTSPSFDIAFLEIIWSLSHGMQVTINPDGEPNNLDRYVDARDLAVSLFFFSSLQTSGSGYDLLKESVVFADKNGFEAVWLPERHFHEFGAIYPNPSVVGSALTTITGQIHIRAGSIVIPLHDTLRVAEEWSVLDNFSGGRAGVSVTAGWNADDFVFYPDRYPVREAVMKEQVAELRQLWSGGGITRKNGRGEEVEVRVFPRPHQQTLPIWITAAGNPATFEFAGSIGANILTHLLGQDLDELQHKVSLYKAAYARAGHDLNQAKVTVMVHTFLGDNREDVKREIEQPFKAYLKSSAGLLQNLSQKLNLALHSGTEQQLLDELAEMAFQRFWDSMALFGTVDSCRPLAEKLREIGVTEIAALIDFGVPDAKIMRGLGELNKLRAGLQPSTRGDGAKVSCIQVTPSHLQVLVEDPASRNFLRSLTCILVGGEPMPAKLFGELRAITDAKVFNMYGPTETTVWSSVDEIISAEAISVGTPIVNTTITLRTDQGEPVPAGVPGELCIGGDGVGMGYLNQPELTHARFVEHNNARYYRTGDRGTANKDSTIAFEGRQDNQIKFRGHRIELSEIETVILQHPGILQAVVALVAWDHDKDLVAYVRAEESLPVQGLKTFLAGKLPTYMIPREVVLMQTFPLTVSGKINRSALPKPTGDALQPVPFVEVENETQLRLRSIWKELLGVEQPISLLDGFFMLGGDSLRAIRLVSRIEDAFNVRIELRAVFANPTLAGLAALIATGTTAGESSIPLIEEQDYYRVSDGQRRLWVLNQFEEVNAAYNESRAMRFDSIDVAALQQAYFAVVARHEILRSYFVDLDGEPYQRSNALDPERYFIGHLATEKHSHDARVTELVSQASMTPFDLSSPPLVRFSVFECRDAAIVLCTIHHIISDGWSMDIIFREVMTMYESLLTSRLPEPKKLPLQYKDFSAWLNLQVTHPDYQEHREFWMEQFASEPPAIDFPAPDATRPLVKTYNGNRIATAIESPVAERLFAASRSNNATPFMFLMSVVNVLIHKYTALDDIVVGTPVSNRRYSLLEDQIGFYLNTLPVRATVDGQQSFSAFLKYMRDLMVKCYAHQQYPFDRLVEEVSVSRNPARSPLFDVLVVLQDTHAGAARNHLAAAHPTDIPYSKYDVSFLFQTTADGIYLEIEYNTDLFYQPTIERMGNNLVQLIQTVLAQPETPLARLEILADAEKQMILTHSKGLYSSFPKSGVDKIFSSPVNAPRATLQDQAAPPVSLGQVFSDSEAMAAALVSQYNIRKGDLVGLHLDKSVSYVVALLATLRAGAAFLPLEKELPAGRLQYILRDSNCKLILSDRADLIGEAAAPHQRVADLAGLRRLKAAPAALPQVHEEDLAYVIYTSGSTGKPKGVMVTHGNLASFLEAMDLLIPVPAKAHFLSLTAISFDISLLEILWSLARGISLTLLEGKDLTMLDAFLSGRAAESGINMVQTTPSMLKVLLRDDAYNGFLGQLETILIGGEALPPDLADRLGQRTRARTFNMYGPTETTIWSTVEELVSAQVCIGRPIANTEVFVLDGHLQMVPLGVPGRLFIGGAGVARGYMNRPELTQERFVKTHFSESLLYDTGDVVKLGPDGRLHYLNRADFQVKIRGHRIEPGEIEQAIRKVAAVRDVVVLAGEDASGEHYLAAFYTAETEVADLARALSFQLPAYMIPSRFISVDTIPLTVSGKVDRKALAALDVSGGGPAKVYKAPVTETEQALAAIWEEVLGRSNIGRLDNFFALGGHSLKGVQIATRIFQRLGVKVPLKFIFLHTDIESLARATDLIKWSTVAQPLPEHDEEILI